MDPSCCDFADCSCLLQSSNPRQCDLEKTSCCPQKTSKTWWWSTPCGNWLFTRSLAQPWAISRCSTGIHWMVVVVLWLSIKVSVCRNLIPASIWFYLVETTFLITYDHTALCYSARAVSTVTAWWWWATAPHLTGPTLTGFRENSQLGPHVGSTPIFRLAGTSQSLVCMVMSWRFLPLRSRRKQWRWVAIVDCIGAWTICTSTCREWLARISHRP